MRKPLLEVKHLETAFYTNEGAVKAVDDVSFTVHEEETVCIVGESGCGKSIASLSIMQLVPETGKIERGAVHFSGRNLLELKQKEMQKVRGCEIGMIFQEPMTSLNPVFTIGEQLTEPLREHLLLSKKEAWQKAVELISLVEIPHAEQMMHRYPHELSGGMLQRIMTAIALSCDPKLIIADEPTTALDVTIQAQILDLLRDVKKQCQTSILLITHDLGVVAEMADYVIVMYAGKIVEEGPVAELFSDPKHPYTKGLLAAKPVIGQRKDTLYTIPGQVPELADLPVSSCYFADRCEYSTGICRRKSPHFTEFEMGHKTACWLYREEKADG
ncbi:ABC transporter ATP-binding protein [Bacillus sp. ISL-51]|uniref:ABC transporter ATP-binding protein n=1 Tax=Bacteria TaxID=2 RepID=UPI001BE6639D|nr:MULTISPECIES: ABC transporter ATP-binding protein [Bacteria]MBT2575547.1 ABC transporter ATP-binding protein [Bacillus sp. ISL-51]MBT2635185.1 ABC transporter ATP-binding protein [Bacillus sp. ISL-26]MBT2711365.1 ABC transporter ATP-binding protein [Pseudomonas sp. ISL-88]